VYTAGCQTGHTTRHDNRLNEKWLLSVRSTWLNEQWLFVPVVNQLYRVNKHPTGLTTGCIVETGYKGRPKTEKT